EPRRPRPSCSWLSRSYHQPALATERGGCTFCFQAEDRIRYRTVTGVQTCALPILLVELLLVLVDGALHLVDEALRLVDVALQLEIGRASCRERVLLWAADVGGQSRQVRRRPTGRAG